MGEQQGKKQRKPMSEATREKIREAVRKLWRDPEYRLRARVRRKRDRYSEASLRRWRDPEHRRRQQELRRDPEWRQRWRAAMLKGWQESPEESRRRVSEAMRRRWKDPENRRRMREAMHKIKEGIERYNDRAALGRLIAEEAGLGPMTYSELAAVAELFLNETEKKS
jgi:hypothetical protein